MIQRTLGAYPDGAPSIVAAETPVAPRERGTRLRGDGVVATVAALGGIQMLAMVFMIARSKAAALVLGPAGVGVTSLIDQVVSLVIQVATLSLPFAAVKFLSAAHSEGGDRFRRLYAAFAWSLLTTTLIATTAVAILVVWRPSLLGRDLSAYQPLVVLALVSIPAITMVSFFTSVLAAARRPKVSGVYGLCNTVALASLSALGVVVGGLRGYYAGTLLAVTALAVGGAAYIRKRERTRIGSPQWGLPELARHRGVAVFAASLYVMSLALPVAHLVARFALLKASGLEAAGLLQSAMALGLALTLVMRQSNMLLLTPIMNRSVPEQQKLSDAAAYLRMFSLTVGLAAVPLVLFPDVWIYLLYSRKFLAASPYAPMFVVAQVLQLFAGVALGLLVGLDRIARQLVVTLTGVAVLAILAWSLAPSMGIAGIGAAFIAEGLVVFTLSMMMVWKACKFPLLAAASWVPVIVLLIIAAIGALSVRYAGLSADVLGIKAAVGIAVTLVLGIIGWRDRAAATSSMDVDALPCADTREKCHRTGR